LGRFAMARAGRVPVLVQFEPKPQLPSCRAASTMHHRRGGGDAAWSWRVMGGRSSRGADRVAAHRLLRDRIDLWGSGSLPPSYQARCLGLHSPLFDVAGSRYLVVHLADAVALENRLTPRHSRARPVSSDRDGRPDAGPFILRFGGGASAPRRRRSSRMSRRSTKKIPSSPPIPRAAPAPSARRVRRRSGRN